MDTEAQLWRDWKGAVRPKDPENGNRHPEIVLFSRPAFDQLLDALGKREQFRKGDIVCPSCEETISWRTLRLIVPRNGTSDFVCDRPSCYHRYLLSSANGAH